jgi:hypothetical protein
MRGVFIEINAGTARVHIWTDQNYSFIDRDSPVRQTVNVHVKVHRFTNS